MAQRGAPSLPGCAPPDQHGPLGEWDRLEITTNAIANVLDLSGEGRMENPDVAGTVSFDKVRDAEMDVLRLARGQGAGRAVNACALKSKNKG